MFKEGDILVFSNPIPGTKTDQRFEFVNYTDDKLGKSRSDCRIRFEGEDDGLMYCYSKTMWYADGRHTLIEQVLEEIPLGQVRR